MSNDIALREAMAAAVPSNTVFDEMVSTGYLPRLQLETSNSAACKKHSFPQNHYQLYKAQPVDLGTSVDVVVIAWQPKALDTSDGQITSSHKPDSEVFQDIKTRSFLKDSGCMYGPEFLVWIPEAKTFATFFCGSKSQRRASGSIKQIYDAFLDNDSSVPAPNITLSSELIETKKHSWFVFRAELCATPLEAPNTQENFKSVLESFMNPVEDKVKAADSNNTDER